MTFDLEKKERPSVAAVFDRRIKELWPADNYKLVEMAKPPCRRTDIQTFRQTDREGDDNP